MPRPAGIDDRPAWLVAIALATLAASLIACVIHSRVATAPAALPGRTAPLDPCIVADEDLRHPGWARPEQARAGQPLLDDPRAARWFVAPAQVQVAR